MPTPGRIFAITIGRAISGNCRTSWGGRCRAHGPQIAAADVELEVPQSIEGEMLSSMRSAVSAAFKSGKSNLIELLRRDAVSRLAGAGNGRHREATREKAERVIGGVARDTDGR